MIDTLGAEVIAYHSKYITSLFVTGFTVGSFLFSMKAVIVKTLKEEVYDHDLYQDEICQKIAMKESVGFYDNLSNFSTLLMKAISWSFISAICQITLGFFGGLIVSVICLTVAVISWYYLGNAIYRVHKNWSSALIYAEKIALIKNKKRIEKHSETPFK